MIRKLNGLKKISNWGRTPEIEAEVCSTANVEEVANFIEGRSQFIARGNGRSYGDASLQHSVFSTLQLRKIIAFESQTGILQAECGLLLSDILQYCIPKGFFLPVLPGTRYVSLGGAIAADIHGKNHQQAGNFSKHLLSLDLLNEQGQIISCSRQNNADLFWQTCGGMGLNGIILRATLQLKKIETTYWAKETYQLKDWDQLLDIFETKGKDRHSVAWLDTCRGPADCPRSIMTLGRELSLADLPPALQTKALDPGHSPSLSWPINGPSFLLNSWTLRAFNTLYYTLQKNKNTHDILRYDSFFFPLDGLQNWNRLYGKKGFLQYQFVLPLSQSREGILAILKTIRKSREQSYLSVLKRFGTVEPQAVNSFPMPGYSLALDFKRTPTIFALLDQLDQMVIERGGRLYLAKDARMSATVFKQSYSKGPFPTGPFCSLQSKRLNAR